LEQDDYIINYTMQFDLVSYFVFASKANSTPFVDIASTHEKRIVRKFLLGQTPCV